MSDFGISGGKRIGDRLYFYFSGHGIGLGSTDVALMMANAIRKMESETFSDGLELRNDKGEVEGGPGPTLASTAERLYSVAEGLLKHADFVLITDPAGKIYYCNGAFTMLISPRFADRARLTEEQVGEARSAKRRQWEAVLESAQVGFSKIENQYETEEWRNWRLSRAEIKDEAAQGSVSHLNLMRLTGFLPFDEETLRKIDSAAANLTSYVPLLIYGSGENKKDYEKKLEEIIAQLQHWINPINTEGRD